MLTWLAALLLLLWIASAVEMGLGTRRIRSLAEVPPIPPARAPGVSVVIAARNEQEKIAEGLRSVLALAYPDLRVIVVDDRSTDATSAILDRLEIGEERLRVVHLEELPGGWLGKNHALARGAELATGEWILFTDADVVFEPSVLSRAMAYALEQRLDHLALPPALVMPSVALDAFAGAFAVFFARFSRPWKARDPRSRRHIGVGAFNLVRAEAYRAIGGHRTIAMRPDDDLKLGKIVKAAGLRQDLVFAGSLVRVEWYSSVREAVRGLEKNTFAGLEYSVPAVVGASLAILLFDVWPFAALFLTRGLALALSAGTVAVILAVYAGSTRGSGTNPLLGLAYPLAALLFVFIVVRSTVLALRNGGIRWRDTLYPLDELRANRV